MCMCASLDSVADSINSPIETNCSTNPSCTGIDCSLMIPNDGTYELQVDIEACQNPPGALVVMTSSDGVPVVVEYFNGSREIMLSFLHPLSAQLTVDIAHQDYSAEVEVYMLKHTYTLIFLNCMLKRTAPSAYITSISGLLSCVTTVKSSVMCSINPDTLSCYKRL